MSEKDGNSPLFLATTKMCTHSVFILLCKAKNLIDNHVKLRGKLKYGHFNGLDFAGKAKRGTLA